MMNIVEPFPLDQAAFRRPRSLFSRKLGHSVPFKAAALLLFTILVLFLRRPGQFSNPYLWVEDGTLTLRSFADHGGLHSGRASVRLPRFRLQVAILRRLPALSASRSRRRGDAGGNRDVRRDPGHCLLSNPSPVSCTLRDCAASRTHRRRSLRDLRLLLLAGRIFAGPCSALEVRKTSVAICLSGLRRRF